MECLRAREAMSAQMDGEPSGAADSLVEAHVGKCQACQAWRAAAFDVTRRVRMTGRTPPQDLADTIIAAVRPRRFAGWLARARVVLLIAAGAGQLALTVPLLADGTAGATGLDMHDAHELGVFDFALGVAFLVGAIRPRLAAGMAWPCSAAAFGLVATSIMDVVDHRTFELHELRHLIAVGGAGLLCWTARAMAQDGPEGMTAKPARSLRRDRRTRPAWQVAGYDDPADGPHSGIGPPPAAAAAGTDVIAV